MDSVGGAGSCAADFSTLTTNYQSLLPLMLTALGIAEPQWPQNARVNKDGAMFDYIIVGAGSAGSVLAHRLTEDPRRSVLLVEAGGDPTAASVIPGLVSQLPLSESDWKYYTENDNYQGQARKDGTIQYTRGKVLGGSSSLNFMVYVRGCKEDYNDYADNGFTKWNWTNALHYFKKSEDLQYNVNDSEYHSTEGPLIVTKPKRQEFEQSRLDTFLNSYGEIGFDLLTDYNGPNIMGVSQFFYTHTHPPGVRCSTAQAFLQPIKDRSNLYVLKHAFATKIIIDEDKTARGVEVSTNGTTHIFFANKEVVVSAGVFNTPKLLTASGIADKADLERLGIHLVSDVPVGKNLMDHFYVPIIFSGSNSTETKTLSKTIKPELNSIPLAILTGFYSLDDNPQPQYQTLSYYFGVNSSLASGNCEAIMSLNESVCAPVIKMNENHELFEINVNLLHPKSTGEVKIVDVAEGVPPKIFTGFFSAKEDFVTMREGIKRILNIINSTYFESVGSKIVKLDLPECDMFEFLTDEYWDCYSLNTASTMYHASGTCAMGKVVDENLKVYGVKNLRVVDASVFRTIPSGNINAPVIMFAEQAADMIRNDHDRT